MSELGVMRKRCFTPHKKAALWIRAAFLLLTHCATVVAWFLCCVLVTREGALFAWQVSKDIENLKQVWYNSK